MIIINQDTGKIKEADRTGGRLRVLGWDWVRNNGDKMTCYAAPVWKEYKPKRKSKKKQ